MAPERESGAISMSRNYCFRVEYGKNEIVVIPVTKGYRAEIRCNGIKYFSLYFRSLIDAQRAALEIVKKDFNNLISCEDDITDISNKYSAIARVK